ncbi:hypothetical protein D3C85_1335450 [compost metagenome]
MLAQLRGRHAARQTFEQGKAELLLQITQHLAQGWLTEVHPDGGGVHVARARQGVNQHQMLEAHPVAETGMGDVRWHRGALPL